jgi:hypothetical protein
VRWMETREGIDASWSVVDMLNDAFDDRTGIILGRSCEDACHHRVQYVLNRPQEEALLCVQPLAVGKYV